MLLRKPGECRDRRQLISGEIARRRRRKRRRRRYSINI